jgi:hypothetical protein
MKPPVEFQDRSACRARMNQLLRIDPTRTVVLTVDMPRGYLDPEVAAAPVTLDKAERVLKHVRDLLDFARGRGLPVVHVAVNRRRVEDERGSGTAGSPQAEVPAWGRISSSCSSGCIGRKPGSTPIPVSTRRPSPPRTAASGPW